MHPKTIIMLTMVCLIGWAGCKEEKQTCRSAANHFLQVRPGLEVEGASMQTPEALAAYCEETQASAAVIGCTLQHAAFQTCLEGVEPAIAPAWIDFCQYEVAALQACLSDTPFESLCHDGHSDDDDSLVDCADEDCDDFETCQQRWSPWNWYFPNSSRNVDLLFVIDNSGSMAGEQANLRASFPALMAELRNTNSGLPNLHIGVTTTDLGTGMFQITYCEQVGGEAGNLVTGSCTNPSGAPYIIDVEPEPCEITREPDNTCTSHTCTQSDCMHELATTIVEDATTGCPRCRNFSGETLEEVFSCIASLGTMGCTFEQPLEAMYKALDSSNSANTGFVRDAANLAVILITDEDDCSASDPQLFDSSQTDLDSTLGPLSSYRCFEFGVTCDINSRTQPGDRQDCVPREDAEALLHPISRYSQFLRSLKYPEQLLLAAIAGPVTPSDSGIGHNVVVDEDPESNPQVQYSCSTTSDSAVPAIRIFNLIAELNSETDLDAWAYTSICADDYTPFLAGVGDRIRSGLDQSCLTVPLEGCADVGVEFGTPQASVTCAINERCLANCQVEDFFWRGTDDETRQEVPPCLEVMSDGSFAAGNVDRTLAYASGHPALRDTDLPVSACWHIIYNAYCSRSNYAELVISRQENPPPRSFATVACSLIYPDELTCGDGLDNDQDCLVDSDDPCCQDVSTCHWN